MADEANLTREMPALSFRASFTPNSVNVEKRTAEMVWTTGARVKRGFWDPYWEELSLDPKHVRMERLNNGAPLLAAHDGYDLGSVLGVVESARLDKGKGTATVRFAKAEDDPAADQVFRKVCDGILQNVSVGYRVYKLEQIASAAVTDDKVEVRLATDWEPYELSIVPMGADDGAGFRSAERRATNPCAFITRSFTEAPARQEKNMAGETQPTTPAAPAAAPSVEELARAAAQGRIEDAQITAAARERIAQESAAQERIRCSDIRTVVMRHIPGPRGEALVEQYVRGGVALAQVREAVLQIIGGDSEGSAIDGHVRIGAGDDARDKFRRGAVASILERSGHLDTVTDAKSHKRIGKYLKDAATDPGEFRGWRMDALARRALEVSGDASNAARLHGEPLIKRALEFRGDAGMNSTSDYAVLLETAVNQVFLGRYATIPVTWPSWCTRKSVQDFRTSTFYRPGTFGVIDTLTESGEVKHKNIPDGAKATLTPATKANIVGISRKAMVNDRLNVFTDLAAGLGDAAGRTIEADAWALITAASGLGANAPDGVALFNAAHANIGTTGAMSIVTLDSMRQKMALQKDASSNAYLAARPFVLLVPVELTGTAKVFNSSVSDPTDYKNSSVANKVYNLFTGGIIDSPYLSASSSTRVYAIADPNVLPVFAIGFIDGQEAPTVTSEQSFEYDGMQIKIVFDYGTAVIDYRGAATCAGA